MMGNKDYNTYDRINLRDLCGDISAFSNGHGKGALSEYSSRDAILKKILPGTSDWEKEITVINKLMSGNGAVKSLKMIPPNIEQDDFRKSVMKKCAVLERIIRNTHDDSSIKMNGKELLQSFMDNCKSMFFKEDEMNALNDCLKKTTPPTV